MQVYTKILIGMLVGAVLGLTLGPKSMFLDADLYKVSSWDRLELRTDRDDPSTVVQLPVPKKKANGEVTPLRLPILETVTETREDRKGDPQEVETWSRVRLTYSQSLSLRDSDQQIRDQLGLTKIDDSAEVWLALQQTELESGGFSVWPVPISGFGDTLVTWLKPIGTAFMRLIKMVIVPLVFSSLLVGVASLGDVRKLGRLGVRTLGLYLGTTAAAVSIGLGIAHLINPGSFIDEKARVALQAQFVGAAGDEVERAAEAPSTIDNILNIIPANPIASLVSGDMLQVIFFAVLFGIALTLLDDKDGRPVVNILDRVQNAMVVIIHIVMKLAPYGVAALVADVVGQSGFSVLSALFVYAATVLLGLAIHGTLVYGFIAIYIAKLKPMAFLRAVRPAQLIAFSTSSSSAALPVTMECAEENLGVSNPVASFVIPLGSTVNMDGTALYQGVAALFIAQVFQMDLSMGAQIGIVATATMASIGAAGVPGAGMVTLAMVLTAAGIPTVGLALILGMDRLLDMFRSALNVTGDLAVTAAMARLEGEKLEPLSKEDDKADPKRGFERRLDKKPKPIEPD
ncbi:MAG: dicarboxylate/amino acid:cation symporter [Nannocystaceae bacterium]|nr:dicarboxylate/amino acid:cation symporter [Nannocystaceae bacterium]